MKSYCINYTLPISDQINMPMQKDIDVSSEHYIEIESIIKCVRKILYSEQLYDAFIEAYVDYKKYIYCLNIENSVFYLTGDKASHQIYRDKYWFSSNTMRGFNTLLNLSKKYLDFIAPPHSKKRKKRNKINKINIPFAKIKLFVNKTHENSKYFRLIYLFRNLEQHINDKFEYNFSHTYEQIGVKQKKDLRTLNVDKDEILRVIKLQAIDDKKKEKDIAILDSFGERVDLLECLDDFFKELSCINMYKRQLISNKYSKLLTELKARIKKITDVDASTITLFTAEEGRREISAEVDFEYSEFLYNYLISKNDSVLNQNSINNTGLISIPN
ncbi:hypothetical protein [Thorsellia anophelis]|uniref:Uncharacterized protein n=1 Tax=Thorsellia anophelis DSM 18579 TaxID=1123402 RepID=A0A1I0FX62_9GAMM|nr:hypothetical protein [Thorsellia anophelis]SET62178.1 hypothetical protein SAMN02583745_02904 [Thorsellia anophelis DSM 18579]